MAMWRCPHCATPQPEAARCWVCHRSSTSCATCRHFRRSVAGGLGFCGLDRSHSPLDGGEIRGCWEAGSRVDRAPVSPPEVRTHVRPRRRDFVPLEPVEPEVAPILSGAVMEAPRDPTTSGPAWSLFPELET